MYVTQRIVFSGPLCSEIEKNQFMAACMVASRVSLMFRHLVNCLVVRSILPIWVDHLKEHFSYI